MKESRYHSYEESTGLLFWQVSTLWQRAVKASLRRFDLTFTQYAILAVIEELSETSEEVTQKQISDFSMIDPMTVSSTLRLLEKKGLIGRNQSRTDSRANTICNTQSAGTLLREAVAAVENVDEAFFFEEETDRRPWKELLCRLKEKNQGAAEK